MLYDLRGLVIKGIDIFALNYCIFCLGESWPTCPKHIQMPPVNMQQQLGHRVREPLLGQVPQPQPDLSMTPALGCIGL